MKIRYLLLNLLSKSFSNAYENPEKIKGPSISLRREISLRMLSNIGEVCFKCISLSWGFGNAEFIDYEVLLKY